jgi:hypothetical protein
MINALPYLIVSSYNTYYYTFFKKIPLLSRDQSSWTFVLLLWWNIVVFSLPLIITLQIKEKLNS